MKPRATKQWLQAFVTQKNPLFMSCKNKNQDGGRDELQPHSSDKMQPFLSHQLPLQCRSPNKDKLMIKMIQRNILTFPVGWINNTILQGVLM